MSERSYRRNRALGVAGPKTNTCFAAAFDRITPEAEVSAETYKAYERSVALHERRFGTSHPNHINAMAALRYSLIASDLGGFSLRDMVFEYANNPRKLGRVLTDLLDSDMRPVIDTTSRDGSVHSLGVVRSDEDHFRLVGYGVPAPLRGCPVTAGEIFPFFHESGYLKQPHWPFVGRNIAALPRPV